MQGIHAVSEYTGLDILSVLKLPCDLYMLCYKNWYTGQLQKTQEGREYLDDCQRYKQTKMDKRGLARLKQMMGGNADG